MIDTQTAPYAAFLLRVGLGVITLAHAALKIFVFTPAGTAHFFVSLGLPSELAYLTMLVEVVAGTALILGVYARVAAIALLPVLIGAIVSVHAANGWLFTDKGGGWEYPAFWALALVVQALLGDGVWALRPTAFREAAVPQTA